MSNKVLFVDYHKCVGCGTCEMVCSLVHEGICSPALSRISIVRDEKRGYFVPITCAMCEKPPCLIACPVKAITKNKKTGEVVLNDKICIGCRQCVQVCPFGHMNFNALRGVAFKCDLCGGDPQCVKFCWTKAIEFISMDEAADRKRRDTAQKIMEEV